MPVIVDDRLVPDLLDLGARPLRAERPRADGNPRDPIDAHAQTRQLQHRLRVGQAGPRTR
jgi:hypothetical protein